MNIFILDTDIETCVKYHCNKHVIKMILESNQLLCTAHHLSGNSDSRLLKVTHKNHPCSLWVRESINNYRFLVKLCKSLCAEYTFRYGKIHLHERNGLVDYLIENVPNLPEGNMTDFKLCMPEEYKIGTDAISSYRNYYLKGKAHMLDYKKREIPDWIRTIVD